MTTDLTRQEIMDLRFKHNPRHEPEAFQKLCDMALAYLDTQPPKVAAPVDANAIYYLKSIKRNLDELKEFTTMLIELKGHGIASEAHADNRDWLDCFIDEHERKLQSPDSREPKAMREAEEWNHDDCWTTIPFDRVKIIRKIQQDALQSKVCALPEWQPSENIPKDGQRFLARLDEHQDVTILHWEQCEFQDDGENYVPENWITGWMLLPTWQSLPAAPPCPILTEKDVEARARREALEEVLKLDHWGSVYTEEIRKLIEGEKA